jgi:hypothetical protein
MSDMIKVAQFDTRLAEAGLRLLAWETGIVLLVLWSKLIFGLGIFAGVHALEA